MEITIKITKDRLDTLHSYAGRLMQTGRRLQENPTLTPLDADGISELGEQLEDFFNDQQPITKMMAKKKINPTGTALK